MINDVYDCNETACGIHGATIVNFIESIETYVEFNDRACGKEDTDASHQAQRVVWTSKLVSHREGNVII